MSIFKQLPQPAVALVQSNVKGLGGFVLYKHGSTLLETQGLRGMSHLGEHMFARAYMQFGDEIANLGLNINASTYGHKIEFYAFGLEASVLEFVEEILLRDDKSVLRHTPSRDDFERERNVVIQEYEGTLSDPKQALWLNVARKHFGYYSAIGNLQDIKDISYEDFIAFYDRTFRQFTGIAYVGDVETVQDRPWSYPSYWAVPGHEDEIQCLTHTAHAVPRLAEPDPNYVGEFYGGSGRETFVMDWIEFDCHEWERKCINEIWNCGTVDSAPLMVALRKTHGLCYAAFIDAMFKPVGILSTYITTAPENVEKVREIVADVFANYTEYITPERHALTLRYMRKILERESLTNFSPGWLSRYYGQEDSLLTSERLDSFTYERCCELLEQFRTKTWMKAAAGEDLVLD